MPSARAIVSWLRGTGLRPFIEPLTAAQRDAFLAEYTHRRNMNTRLLKLARTFVSSILIVAASGCAVTPEVPKGSVPKAAAIDTEVAQAGYVRIRGAITAIADDAITVRTRTGQELRVNVGKTPVNAI